MWSALVRYILGDTIVKKTNELLRTVCIGRAANGTNDRNRKRKTPRPQHVQVDVQGDVLQAEPVAGVETARKPRTRPYGQGDVQAEPAAGVETALAT